MSQKGDFEDPKVPNYNLVLNQSPISAVFPLVRFTGDQKTALTGESLYKIIYPNEFVSNLHDQKVRLPP